MVAPCTVGYAPATAMSSAIPELSDVVASKYRIERQIGSGGMGTVFCATHLMTGRRFALKWMNPDVARDEAARERFIREFQTAGSIMHPNVAAVLDVGTHGDSLFIVMEYLEGEPLSARIAAGPMAPGECIPIVLEAMSGVAAAHERGMVHRDLKPDNIFVCRGPQGEQREAKVLDFGIVKAIDERHQTMPAITQRGAIIGTPPYMAPEQVLGLEGVDHRVDVYAFGVILYEALSGRLPFTAQTVTALMVKIATEAAPPLASLVRDLPPGLEAVVMKALARAPQDRHATLEGFARALKAFAKPRSIATPSFPLRAPESAAHSTVRPSPRVRVGFGSYTVPLNNIPGNTTFVRQQIPDLSYPLAPFISQGTRPLQTVSGFAWEKPDLYSQQWNLTLVFQVSQSDAVQAAYMGNHGLNLRRNLNINFFDPALGRRPNTAFSDINIETGSGQNIYHGLQLSWKRRLSRGFQFEANYTWAHAIDDVQDQGLFSAQPQDNRNWKAERGNSSGDTRHNFSFSTLYELPFGAGQRWLGGTSGADREAGRRLEAGGARADPLRGRDDGLHRDQHLRQRELRQPAAERGGGRRPVRRRPDPEPVVQPGGLLAPGPGHLRQPRAEHGLRPELPPDRHFAAQGHAPHRGRHLAVPRRGLQRLQPAELRPAERDLRDAELRPHLQHLRAHARARDFAPDPVRAEVVVLIRTRMRRMLPMTTDRSAVIGSIRLIRVPFSRA